LTYNYIYIQRDGKTLSTYIYDAIGRVATYVCCNLPGLVKDRAGRITYYDYDALKRLIRVQDSAGNTVSYQYDANGNRTKLIDANGNTTLWSYDASNRVVRKTYADQHNQQYSYSGGLLSATQNEKGQVTHYQYDNDSKLTKIDYPNMTDVTFSYDGLDRLASMTDGMGTTSYTYTDLNQLNSVSGIWQNDGVGYSYDNLGRRTGMSVQRDASNNDVTSYAYDDLSRLSSISSGAGTFGYSYVGNSSMLTQIDLPNGEKSTFTYDALERLTQIHNLTSADANVSQYSYAYDNTTHLPGRVSETSQVGTDDSIVRNYGYDPVDQLISETVTQNGQTTQSKTYAYDPMGNRTGQTYQYSPDPLHTVSYANNSLNQTTGTSNTDGTTTTQSTFTYDANGNTTQITLDTGTRQYSYDDADRLTAIVYKDDQGVNTSKSTFDYDGLNRLRVSHKYTWNTQTSAWVQQSEKRRIYDGMDVVQERDENNAVTNAYTRNGNPSASLRAGAGGILAMVHYTPDGSGGFTADKYFYHYDGRGNVTQLTNEGQNIVATYTYDAFGNTIASGAGAGLNAYRFSTKEQISGLYYYGYRFYSPGIGKWINRDPIQEAGGINIYGFVGNSPTNLKDKYGLVAGVDDLGEIAGAFAVGGLANVTGDILGQLIAHNFNAACIDWLEVGKAFLMGGLNAVLSSTPDGILLQAAYNAVLKGIESITSAIAAAKMSGNSVNWGQVATNATLAATDGFISGAISSKTNIQGIGKVFGKSAMAGGTQAAMRGLAGFISSGVPAVASNMPC